MLRNMTGWGGWGMMLTFLELAYMADATQHDGVGWVGNDVNKDAADKSLLDEEAISQSFINKF